MMLQGFRNLGLVLNSEYLPVRDYVLVTAFILVDKDAYATGVGILGSGKDSKIADVWACYT